MITSRFVLLAITFLFARSTLMINAASIPPHGALNSILVPRADATADPNAVAPASSTGGTGSGVTIPTPFLGQACSKEATQHIQDFQSMMQKLFPLVGDPKALQKAFQGYASKFTPTTAGGGVGGGTGLGGMGGGLGSILSAVGGGGAGSPGGGSPPPTTENTTTTGAGVGGGDTGTGAGAGTGGSGAGTGLTDSKTAAAPGAGAGAGGSASGKTPDATAAATAA